MILLVAACQPVPVAGPVDPDVGALADGPLNPFPSVEVVADGHVAIPEGLLAQVEGGTALDVTRLNWRTGFSPVQPSVARFEFPLDRDSLPLQEGIGTGGSVRMIDLDTGDEIPVLAETDAYPDDLGDHRLIVRPMQAMTLGHRVAVAVTSAVTTEGGALPLPEPTGYYADLVDEIEALGIPDVVLAWDFPVGDGTMATRTIAAIAAVPAEWDLKYTYGEGGEFEAIPQAWKQAKGSFVADDFLVGDTTLEIDSSGVPTKQSTTDAFLFVHIPASLKDAPPASAPVLVFGHGILASPEYYLADEEDGSSVLALAEDLGAIVVGTRWRGLTDPDQLHAIQVAQDFGRFPEIPDMLAQGVGNTVSLIRLVAEGGLTDDPFFGGIADPSRIYYYGISLGGIEGAVTLANQDLVSAGVLHVGGCDWSTMLERSSQWTPFEILVVRGIEDAWDRQVLYATTQMLWDQVDPAAYVDDLRGRSLLWQEAMGDEQVPNITTELLQRSLDNPVGTPNVTTPVGIGTVALPAPGPAFTQFDPMVGEGATTNRPPSGTGAHSIPRNWPGARAQVVEFLTSGGTVAHHCGSAVCSANNTGD